MTSFKSYIVKTQALLLYCFVIILPFDLKLLPPILIGLIVFLLLTIKKSDVIKNIAKYKPYFIAFVLLYLYMTISLIWTSDIESGLKQLEHRSFYIAAPLLFIILGQFSLKKVMYLFVCSCFIICILNFSYLCYFFVTKKMYFIDRTIKEGLSIDTITYLIFHGRMNFNFFGGHRTYFSFSLLVSILFLLFTDLIVLKRWVKYLIISTFSFVVFFLQAKITVIILIVMLIIFYFLNIRKLSSKLKLVSSIAFIGFLVVGGYISRPRFNRMLKEFNNISVRQEGSIIERIQYTKCATHLIAEKPVFGYGMGDVKAEMKRKKTELGFKQRIENESFDPHNELLKTYVGTGIIGFLILIGAFILPFHRGLVSQNRILVVFVGIVFLISLVEPFLSRQAGILPSLFFIGLLANLKEENSRNEQL